MSCENKDQQTAATIVKLIFSNLRGALWRLNDVNNQLNETNITYKDMTITGRTLLDKAGIDLEGIDLDALEPAVIAMTELYKRLHDVGLAIDM